MNTLLSRSSSARRELHPFLKMPAMRHGKVSLFETAAIATYVDAIGSGPRLQPDRAENAALMWQWVSSAVDYLYDPLVRSALADGGDNDAAREAREVALDAVENRAAYQPFLIGDALTLADLFIVPMVAFAIAGKAGGADDMLAPRPRLAAWYEVLAARDSFKRTAG